MNRGRIFIRAGCYEFNLGYVIMTEDVNGPGKGDIIVTVLPGKEVRLGGEAAESFRTGFAAAMNAPDFNHSSPPGGSSPGRLHKRPRSATKKADGGK